MRQRTSRGTTGPPPADAMIKGMSHVCLYVLDQDSAKAFYTERLGFELRTDVVMGEG